MEYPTYLIHYGIPGQKWGERRYQNEDGTWTEEGLIRRRKEQANLYKSIKKDVKKGKFNPDNYSDNKYIKDAIKSSKSKSVDKNKISEIISGKYLDKKIKDVKENKEYKKYVDDIVKSLSNKNLDNKEDLKKSEVNKDSIISNNKEVDRLESDIEWANENSYFRKELLDEVYPKIKNSLDGVDIIESNSKIYWLKKEDSDDFFKNNKRISDATDLAIKALGDDFKNYNYNAGYLNKTDSNEPTKYTFLVNSFNYPDENKASGLVQIADLVNQGYTKDQIINTIRLSSMLCNNFDSKLRDKSNEEFDTKYALSMYSPESREKFIDKCIELKGNELSDAKQSRIKALAASGKTQEEIAKMLGVSISTVNKYK